MHTATQKLRFAPLDRVARLAAAGRPPAVVFGASVNGLSFARSLGRRGVPVLMIDAAPLIGTYTRYAAKITVGRGPEESAALFAVLDALADGCSEQPVLFPTSDHYCVFVGDNEQRLSERFRFLQPHASAIRAIVDKRTQYRIADLAGVPLPPTFFPESAEELATAAAQLRYPAILKPYTPDDRPDSMREKAIKVLLANDPEELIKAGERAAAMDLRVMVQEVVPGGDDALYGYWGFWDEHGRERAWVTKRKRRQSPPLFGDGSFQETVESPEILALTRRLLGAFDYRGFAGVEYKLDPRDGVFRLMEINPRSESGNQLAISAGVDLPWIGYRYLLGETDETLPAVSAAFGVKFINEEWDLKSFLALRRRGELTAGGWLRSLRGVSSFALAAPDDPMPFIVSAGRVLRAALRRAFMR